jgi:hypothetical protein
MSQHHAHHSAHLGDHILDIFLLLRKLLPFQGIFDGGVAVVSDLLLEPVDVLKKALLMRSRLTWRLDP